MSSIEQRERNRLKQQAYRAKKRAEREGYQQIIPAIGNAMGEDTPGTSVDTSPIAGGVGVDEPVLSINVKADESPKQKPSLRERLLGKKPQATPTPIKRASTRGRKATQPNLIVTLLPTLVASLIATYAKDRIPDEYRACAPSQQEVQGIIGPLFSIIGRRVDVAAEVSQDVIDITNSLVCGIAYGVRAYVVYVEIKKSKELGTPYEQKQQHPPTRQSTEQYYSQFDTSEPETDLSRGLRAYQDQTHGTPVNPSGQSVERPPEQYYGIASNGADSADDGRELRDQEAALVANLFARDRGGRVRLGLLPG